MTEIYDVDELDRRGVILTLTPSEKRALRCVREQIGVEWREDGLVRIYSRGNVGTIALSPQTTVRVTTKVPVANLLAMAGLAFETEAIPPSAGDALIDSAEPVVDILAVLLIAQLEGLLTQGLRQDYVVMEDELPFVRGRLRFDQVLTWRRPGLIPCEFADFLPDTTENRVLRLALEILLSMRLLPGVRTRINWLLPSFHGVKLVSAGRRLLSSSRITRLNEHYRPAHELSRLVIERLGIEADIGRITAPAYFFPLETIFEKAITNFVRRKFAHVYPQFKRSYQSVAGSQPASLSFFADIAVGKPPRMVIDTKYAEPEVRNQYGGWSFHNEHVYQVTFYGLSLGCPAMLVYPRVNRDVDATFDVEGVTVSIVTVDLLEPGVSGLACLVDLIAARLTSSSIV